MPDSAGASPLAGCCATRPHGAGQIARQRIVAAGIEKQDVSF